MIPSETMNRDRLQRAVFFDRDDTLMINIPYANRTTVEQEC